MSVLEWVYFKWVFRNASWYATSMCINTLFFFLFLNECHAINFIFILFSYPKYFFPALRTERLFAWEKHTRSNRFPLHSEKRTRTLSYRYTFASIRMYVTYQLSINRRERNYFYKNYYFFLSNINLKFTSLSYKYNRHPTTIKTDNLKKMCLYSSFITLQHFYSIINIIIVFKIKNKIVKFKYTIVYDRGVKLIILC